ncbi:amino acid adenylation domain-containing protein [Kosakonia quasisacchari]|uniref:Amino acid adenylation domain-containing protein n=1 Tax=Kosakonia quasisacchari TaxID=2529380 RepID=A0A4R0HDM8_9ENTR|nr:non-ribosomal peptide synthetase [Kosakonia quasisacchari]TCC09265.1 amino acid adenylation domain-containing protein [Kosakonia quasisacchari]
MIEKHLFPGQTSIYSQTLLSHPCSDLYNEIHEWVLEGNIDADVLGQALCELTRRRTVLRTSFVRNHSLRLVRRIDDRVKVDFSWQSVPSLEEVMPESHCPNACWDLQTVPLIKWKLAVDDNSHYLLTCNYHHIILDGWSLSLLLEEMVSLYNSMLQGLPLPPIQNDRDEDFFASMSSSRLADEAFWEDLNTPPQSISAHLLHTRSTVQPIDEKTDYHIYHGEFSASAYEKLQQIAMTMKVPTSCLIQALWVLAYKKDNTYDAYFAVSIALHTVFDAENCIGMLNNILPVYVSPSFFVSLKNLTQQIFHFTTEAIPHSGLPFETLYTLSNQNSPPRNLESLVVIENQSFTDEIGDLIGVNVITKRPHISLTSIPLVLSVHKTEPVTYTIVARTSHYDSGEVNCIKQRFADFLAEDKINEEFANIGKSTASNYSDNKIAECVNSRNLLHDHFLAHALSQPEKMAIRYGKQHITYQQLESESARIAAFLIGKNLSAESIIGLSGPRTPQLIAAFIGILRAGLVALLIDHRQPLDYIRSIISVAQPAGILLSEETDWSKESILSEQWIINEIPPSAETSLPISPTHYSQLAYLIFTSGTTGLPKGVAIEHQSSAQFINWALSYFSATELSMVPWCTSISFDLSIFEIFAPLSSGGTLVILDSPLAINQETTQGVTMINTVPSALLELIKSGAIPESVCCINTAGEPLPPQLVTKLLSYQHIIRVNNLYGPTEDTTYSTCCEIKRPWRSSHVTIGYPLFGKSALILDENLRHVETGVPGELYLSGVGLARGYLNSPRLTACNFIPNPYSTMPGTRMYKAGDRAVMNIDGSIQYLGRYDNQVKINGIRLELEGVEAVVNSHPAIDEAAVQIYIDEGGDTRLIAFFVPFAELSPHDLLLWLRKKMPVGTVPARAIVIEKLPRTANGKIDRKALTVIRKSIPKSFTPTLNPRNKIDDKLIKVWQEILHNAEFSVDDNFFDAGGNSILIHRVWTQLKASYNIDLIDLYQYTTIRSLADFIEQSSLVITHRS